MLPTFTIRKQDKNRSIVKLNNILSNHEIYSTNKLPLLPFINDLLSKTISFADISGLSNKT